MLVAVSLFACEPDSPPPHALTAAEAADDLRISVQAWRRLPDDTRRGSVTHAVERALSVPEPSPAGLWLAGLVLTTACAARRRR